MKPTGNVTILIGAPLQGDEARFLRTLHADLAATGALILANFEVKHRQVDFVVVTSAQAAILELKNFSRPIFGQVNGNWRYLDFAGNRVEHPGAGADPYRQALEQKYALSDEMERYRASNPSVPAANGGTFYRDLAGFVCVCPAIHVDSKVTSGDHKLRVMSYQDVLAELRGSVTSKWGPAEVTMGHEAEAVLSQAPITRAGSQHRSGVV
jgi:hypothetical protein